MATTRKGIRWGAKSTRARTFFFFFLVSAKLDWSRLACMAAEKWIALKICGSSLWVSGNILVVHVSSRKTQM
ncbi:hypothetical protein HZ326_26175 [Fusarium oxysporum f. sp. albedinis]|nr:hypothetical protein HZ326_26175 [Fusarium oxysporum f. sp. albedinis]